MMSFVFVKYFNFITFCTDGLPFADTGTHILLSIHDIGLLTV